MTSKARTLTEQRLAHCVARKWETSGSEWWFGLTTARAAREPRWASARFLDTLRSSLISQDFSESE